MSKTLLLIAIIFVMALIVGGCATYSDSYRYAPYGAYYHYPYGDHDYPFGYHGYGHHGGWHRW